MLTEVKVPAFPESVTDGVVAVWHKKPGDQVRRDETLVDIETDKVLFEVPAPADGVLVEVVQAEGATVTAGETLARVDEQREFAATVETPAAKPSSEEQTATVSAGAGAQRAGNGGTLAGPAARRLMVEHGLNAEDVAGSGQGGRILKEDVLRSVDEGVALRARNGSGEHAGSAQPEAWRLPSATDRPAVVTEERAQRRVPMTRLRARIAERLVEAQHTAAILTTFNEVNMQPVIDLRRRYRERFEAVHGVKLGFMSFFVRAAVEALRRYPMINASIEGEEIVYHGFYDIGIAVASPRGLVVPVLRDADRATMAEIERRIADYADRATAGTLTLEEIAGGTFTITNGGVFGSMLSTPIINPPQSAILGMHRIQERAMVENGTVLARPMMYLALSYDHRLIDGREAVLFLVAIKELLEDPARLLLEV
ncbi:MAG: 2-oxoglutarate dehydrogenase complex dihydrolipoyllysine-residue succinyltransferase [Gammaproteobacteria bacterium]|jgi:2-oxoglutarate dehydrogenase E2 component (dihydrolipoamide succinyltransferase)|nr:2-oxoglutarate dehydrogenase complex dihydrolipoyllysine-residue succinyltransferase [Gammaproteobacteria bacterium]